MAKVEALKHLVSESQPYMLFCYMAQLIGSTLNWSHRLIPYCISCLTGGVNVGAHNIADAF